MLICCTTCARLLDVLRFTTIPPAGAATPRTTDPVAGSPPVTLSGDTLIVTVGLPLVSIEGGRIVKLADTPPSVVIVTTVG